MWEAIGRYSDGTEIVKYFPYSENGNYVRECDRQYELEEWLITVHEDCVYYSVCYVSAEYATFR